MIRAPLALAAILAIAADGYRAVFSLAEVAPALGGLEVLVADSRENAPLNESEGPLRLVVPGDKRQTRWVRHGEDYRCVFR